jgi:hypothetical protein
MSFATCSVCDMCVDFVERTPGNVEMRCPSCDMWVSPKKTPETQTIETIKSEAKKIYDERTSVIIKNKVDYYNNLKNK